ncbi:Hypothetical protein R9X50_00611500 [Acrodontium crateriforme]|uniref:ER membrane protein complex subunit 1 n=1 Tax=Acrodontium crateriforme TaxID=150365 RepID=A0AAQ3RDH5_9PEZI|nr:Hypothetical protein R9X50_00611500 [Acrodontium crateriforme]
MRLPLVVVASALLGSVTAVFEDEAWNVDYQFSLLGEPKEDTTFFHQPNPNSRASLLYTLSEKGVLGAVNPKDGTIVWRHLLAPGISSSNASFLRAGEGQDIVVSSVSNQVAAWGAADGRQAWNVNLDGPVADVEILELSDGKETAGVKDAVALIGGVHSAVQRIDGATGAVKWQTKLDSSDTAYQVSASSTEVFAILLHKTMLGYVKIKVISLDPVTGQKTDEYVLSSDSELSTAETIVSVGANSASPIIAWTDAAHTVLKVNLIGTKGVSSFNIEKAGDKNVNRVRLHAPYRVNSLAHFLVHFETESSHWADVFHIDLKKSKIEKAYSLPKLTGTGAFSTSTSDANVYFTRATRDEIVTISSTSHGVLGKWPLNGFGVVGGQHEIVGPVHSVSDVSVKGESVSAIRTAILTTTGDWTLLRGSNIVWHRPEVLAGTVSATFVNPAKAEALVHELEIEAHSNPVSAYVHRVLRHVEDLHTLPALIASLPQKVVGGFLGTSADDVTSDTFGFNKIIACVTESGRLVALNAGIPGQILWSEQIATPQPNDWKPSFVSTEGGLIKLSLSDTAGSMTFNASTGELMANALVVDTENDAASANDITYTLREQDGELLAKQGGKVLWQFNPISGERIVTLTPRPVNDPVASIGKVLGDRNVLYKYLSPNSALVLTANDAKHSVTSYILDTASGAVLSSNTHNNVDLSGPVTSIMSENWFAYSFAAEASDESPKGYQLIVGEMFESLMPNDRGPLGESTNFSSVESSAHPHTLINTYQIPEAISKLAVTRTRQGITSRQLLAVVADSDAIVGIPYNALDPRRPVNRDPTKDEQMEGLVRYNPVIEFDPKWYLNHQREVIGIKDVITAPATIESTSLVFAYGLDIFGTRLSPSFSFDILGKDFNKFQMLATVAALAVLTFVVAPLVNRKQVDQRWQF